eukprot:1367001-Rhodomonas_salina.1
MPQARVALSGFKRGTEAGKERERGRQNHDLQDSLLANRSPAVSFHASARLQCQVLTLRAVLPDCPLTKRKA